MMLREELKDEDIPHRTTVRNRILEIWDEHLDQLANEMQVCLHTTLPFYYQSLRLSQLRSLWGRYRLRQTCGPIQISRRLWL